ncbi:hypothetical protein [Allorhodopirellula heiligendammensis]|uniref:Uncharacterized protein n=1 Tax=Allorhodopirellula heiligendammensis TaxID=2714739 RepID=A0A5C6C381_9BACT|nr:hypothetical protein [Allorhodopirellula heiligendammensis]TWU18588.1 hypothetical protein Poly21_07520 [Allorhodopirellula heiligendammensis]
MTKKKRQNPSSTPSEGEEQSARAALSKDEIVRRWRKIKSSFPDMSEAERVDEFRRFWEFELEATELDPAADCLYSSTPIMRVFTICHDELAKGYLSFKGEKLSTHEETMVAVQDVKDSIAATICRLGGVVKEGDGPDFGYLPLDKPSSRFHGFQEGFGSDDHLVGMFFSEVSRTAAIQKVTAEWGQYGVRSEPYREGGDVHYAKKEIRNFNFDKKEFRKQFAKLSHEDRLTAIDDLSANGIQFKSKDRKTHFDYKTRSIPFGEGKNSRCFSYEFQLGHSKGSLPPAHEKRDGVDRIERTLLGIIAKHDGFVTRIQRDILGLPKPCMKLQDSENSYGYGNIQVQFPNETARRRASEEVFETLASDGVRFESEAGETLSVDEQIAKAHQELASKRKELDSSWSSLRSMQEFHRDGVAECLDDEARLNQREIEFKDFESEVAERLEELSREQTDSSDGESMCT